MAKNSILSILCAAADLIFPFFTSVYTAGILCADGMGKISFAQNAVSCFTVLAGSGLYSYGIRETAGVRGDREHTDRLFSELVLIGFAAAVCVLAGYVPVVLCVKTLKTEMPLFLAFGLELFLNSFNISWFYEGQEAYAYILGRNMFMKVCSAAAVLVWVRTREDYVVYAWIMSLAGAGNRILDLYRIRGRVRPVLHGLSVKRHLKPLGLFTVHAVSGNLYDALDVLMLGMLSTESAAGYYSCANMFVRAVLAFCTAVLSVWYPGLSGCCRKEQGEFLRFLQYEIKLLLFLTLPASAGIFLLAPHLLMVLSGGVFLPAVRTFRILSVLIFVKSIGVLGSQLAMATGNEKIRIRLLCQGTVGRILSGFFLIAVWSDCGAAAGLLICDIQLNLRLLLELRKRLRFEIPWKAFWQALISTAVMGAAVFACMKTVSAPLCKCVLGIVCGGIVYSAANLLMKNELILLMADGMGRMRYKQ